VCIWLGFKICSAMNTRCVLENAVRCTLCEKSVTGAEVIASHQTL
jgi:hypothetical protein